MCLLKCLRVSASDQHSISPINPKWELLLIGLVKYFSVSLLLSLSFSNTLPLSLCDFFSHRPVVPKPKPNHRLIIRLGISNKPIMLHDTHTHTHDNQWSTKITTTSITTYLVSNSEKKSLEYNRK